MTAMWLWTIVSFKFFMQLSVTLADVESTADCQVMVREPWPTPYVFVPRDSSVTINCTGPATTADILSWSIRLPNEDIQLNFFTGTATLASSGVYELPPVETQGMPQTLRLLINDTARNNGTEIICSNGGAMYLFVVEFVPVTLAVLDIDVNGINISWSQDSSQVAVSDAVQTFSLTVSHGSSSQMISLNDSFYYFTAPEDAPPCEVYNFSVTATYVGATYTGAGCSVLSPVISTMLPSLPNIERLDVEYYLMQTSSKITLTVTFEAASYCRYYPVLNYSLEVKGPSFDVLSQSVSTGVENFIHNLTENTIYLFRVLVYNSVGVESTKRRHIFTTDVQNVTVTNALMETFNAFVIIIRCDFITGSNAQGCMVVLVGEFDNITANFSNLEENSSKVLTVSHPLSCYHEIFAFDIESDGSVGTLAVPGVIQLRDEGVVTSCPSTTTTATTTSGTTTSSHTLLITTITVVVLVVLALVMSALVAIVVYNKFECCLKVNRAKIMMKPNEVYGVNTTSDCSEIVTTHNEVYGVSLSSRSQ